MLNQTRRGLYMAAGFTALGLGILGIPLPLLPTTPFLLLAGFCFARGSERWHQWLMNHEHLGPPIHAWRDHRAIPKRVKLIVAASVPVLPLLSYLGGAPVWMIGLQILILIAVTVFLWTRPEPPIRRSMTDCSDQETR